MFKVMLVSDATQSRVLSSSVQPIGTTSTALERSLWIFVTALQMFSLGQWIHIRPGCGPQCSFHAKSFALQYFSHTGRWAEVSQDITSRARSDAPKSAATRFAISSVPPYSWYVRPAGLVRSEAISS